MTVTSFINADNMLAALKAGMNQQMMAAAEPAIQEAVKQAEIAIRQRLGAMFIGLIDQSFVVDRQGTDIRILVKQERSNAAR